MVDFCSTLGLGPESELIQCGLQSTVELSLAKMLKRSCYHIACAAGLEAVLWGIRHACAEACMLVSCKFLDYRALLEPWQFYVPTRSFSQASVWPKLDAYQVYV